MPDIRRYDSSRLLPGEGDIEVPTELFLSIYRSKFNLRSVEAFEPDVMKGGGNFPNDRNDSLSTGPR